MCTHSDTTYLTIIASQSRQDVEMALRIIHINYIVFAIKSEASTDESKFARQVCSQIGTVSWLEWELLQQRTCHIQSLDPMEAGST